MDMQKPRVAGIILAAGFSERMEGQNKLLLPFHGKPLLQHIINVATNSALHKIIVVLPANFKDVYSSIDFTDVQCITCGSKDKFASLQTGLALLDKQLDGCMVIPADLPLLQSSSIDFLFNAYVQDKQSWTVPTQEEMRGKVYVIPTHWWNTLIQTLESLNTRDFFSLPGIRLRLVKTPHSDLFLDINTPYDIQRIHHRFPQTQEESA